MNETYQEYVNRVTSLTMSVNYNTQLQNIQKSPKFESGKPKAFPGYSVVNPPWEDDNINDKFYNNLQNWQLELCEQLGSKLIVPIPPPSFHFTIADLIWNDNYLEAIEENPEFESQLHQAIAKSFAEYQQKIETNKGIIWRSLGLMIKPRAIMVSLVPKDEESYQRIIKLRRTIYQNSDLIRLGIEQQYDLTAHITVGYFGEDVGDRNNGKIGQLEQVLSQFNEKWLASEDTVFSVERAELRKFDDMMRYYRQPDWPAVAL